MFIVDQCYAFYHTYMSSFNEDFAWVEGHAWLDSPIASYDHHHMWCAC